MFQVLPANLFSSNRLLSSMDLSNNELLTVPTTFFSHSPRLAFVDLSMNHLKTMSPEIFLPCPKLTQIILRDNELSHAHSSWFRAFYYKSRYRFKVFQQRAITILGHTLT